MSEFYTNNLIEFSELSRAITWLITQVKKHEGFFASQSKSQKDTEALLNENTKQIVEVQSTLKSFNNGLMSIHKIEEKLGSWSERFRAIDETTFELNGKLTVLESNVLEEFKRIKLNKNEDKKWIVKVINEEIDQKITNCLNSFQKQISEVNNEVLNLKNDIDQGAEEGHNAPNQRVNSLGTSEADKSNFERTGGNKSEEISKSLIRSGSVLGINSRLMKLESQFAIAQEEKQIKRNERNNRGKIEYENKDLDTFKRSFEKTMKNALREMKVYKEYIDSLDLEKFVEKYHEILVKNQRNPAEIEVSEMIEELENNNVWTEIKKIKEQLNHFDEKLEDLCDKCENLSFSERLFTENSKPHFTQKVSHEESNENSTAKLFETMEILKKTIEEHQTLIEINQETIEKLQNLSPHFIIRTELDDILLKFSKKIRDPKKIIHVEADDISPKVFEQEQRLNKIWRSHNNSLELIQKIEGQIANIEKVIVQLQENKSINVEFKISHLESSISDQIKEVKDSFKLFENVPELQALENEKYFRSMIYDLKAELADVKEEISRIKANPPPPSPELSLNPVSYDEIQEPIQVNLLQNILKQHDAAIRMLSNKCLPKLAEEREQEEKQEEKTAELKQLGELKKEMKEMLAKREENQRLSKKDMELVQRIAETVEEKVGKEQLVQMAEKEDLKRIYSLLKKRIDRIADAMRKRGSPAKEEPFFTKKSMKLECASCGSITTTVLDRKLTIGEYAGRMPSKSPPTGIAYSKLLSSLLPNSRGGLRLPAKAEGRLEPLSPKQPGSIFKKK